MIAYLKNKDVTIEVPDDISDAELADIQNNFSQYEQNQPAPAGVEPTAAPKDGSEPTPADTQPNFFGSAIEPVLGELEALGRSVALGPSYFAGDTERGQALAGKATEQMTFGLSKPITDKLDEVYKKHPVYAAAGEVTGGLGSLMTVSSALRLTQLPVYALEAGGASAKFVAEGPRFIAPAIMSAATFGTRSFINKTVESFHNGGVDIEDFGLSVLSETVLGGLFGAISGLASPVKAVSAAALAGYTSTAIQKKGPVPPGIASAAGLGYIYSQMDGGDQVEAGLNAAIWGLFELVGSYGREETLRRAAIHTLGESVGDYIAKKSPGIGPDKARRVGHAIIHQAAAKHGGVEEIAKSGPEGTLGFIERVNQDVRNAKVQRPATPPASVAGPAYPGGEQPSGGLPTDIQKPSAAIRIPPEIAATMPPETAKAVEGALNAAAGAQEPAVPEFKNTDEAVAYGIEINGNPDKIGALKQARAEIESQRESLKGIRGRAQERLDLAVKAQFLREAIQTAEQPLDNEKKPWEMTREEFKANFNLRGYSKLPAGEMGQASGLSAPAQSVLDEWGGGAEPYIHAMGEGGKVAIFRKRDLENQGPGNSFLKKGSSPVAELDFSNVKNEDPHKAMVRKAVSEGVFVPLEVLNDYPDLKPSTTGLAKVVETPTLPERDIAKGSKKKSYPALSNHKRGMEELIKDISLVEKTEYGPVKDEENNVVINKIKRAGFTPEHLQGMGIEKSEDIPLLKKALNGEPLTAKQHNRIVDLLEAKYQAMVDEGQIPQEPDPSPSEGDMSSEDQGGDTDFDPDTFADADTYRSSKPGKGRQYGGPEDKRAELVAKLGNLDEIVAITGGPEIVKLAKSIIGDVPTIKKIMRSLGYFRPKNEEIALWARLFQEDPRLWKAVLLHEIGHAMDYQPDKTMARGNILGRLATFKNYRLSLLPESPASGPDQQPLTDQDRANLRAEAEKIARGKSGTPAAADDPENQFDPQAILDVWNKATQGDIHPGILAYVKGLDAAQKKALVISAMKALKNNEKITINDVKKFNKEAAKDPAKAAEIYKDLLRKEILKRKLYEEEVITAELKALTQYWKPFNPSESAGNTAYRFSSVELYADFISALLMAPGKAKEIAPTAFKAFFNYLQNKPDVMKSLLEIQGLVQGDNADLQRIRYEDLLEMFERGEDVMRQVQADREAARTSTWDTLRMLFWDVKVKAYDVRNKMAKKQKIAPAEDLQYAIEKYSMMGAFARSFSWDYERSVIAPARQAGVDRAVAAILYLDRVEAGDRQEMANPSGFTPAEAREVLNYLETKDMPAFLRAQELAQNAREWFKTIMENPGVEDAFSPEQLFVVHSGDKYVPFRVQKYMEEAVSAGFFSQFGTFEDIGDPLTSNFKKGIAAAVFIERNRLKKIAGEQMLKSGLVKMERAKVTQIKNRLVVENPKKSYLGTMMWKDGGKWVAYHLDKDLAKMFDYSATSEIAKLGGSLSVWFGNNIFRNIWITFNPTFQIVNLVFYDFWRTWRNSPGLSIAKALKLYIESVPQAMARAQGRFDPLIQEMEREGALQVTFNDLLTGRNAEDRELEREFEKFDIIANKENKYKGVPVIEQITAIAEFLRVSGDTIEALPKVVGWKALDYMDAEERAYYVRNLIGTPSFTRKGKATPLVNAFFPFSNVFKEAFRGLLETAFFNKRTRGKVWAAMAAAMALKVMMVAVEQGMFGKGPQDVMRKASEYDKTNYVVIPFGINEQGDGVYLRIPQDHETRLIGGLLWKMMNRDGDALKNVQEVLSFGAEQYPGAAPGPKIAINWGMYLFGKKPYDKFRQQDVLTDQEQAAGIKYGFEPMVRWTINETGLARLDVHDRLRDEPIYKTVNAYMPLTQRLIKISKQGEREIASAAARKQKGVESRRNLDITEAAKTAIKKGVSETEFMSGAKTSEDQKKYQETYNRLKRGLSNDAYVQAIINAGSSEQKAAILREAKKGFETPGQFDDYLKTLWANKIISDDVFYKIQE